MHFTKYYITRDSCSISLTKLHVNTCMQKPHMAHTKVFVIIPQYYLMVQLLVFGDCFIRKYMVILCLLAKSALHCDSLKYSYVTNIMYIAKICTSLKLLFKCCMLTAN